MRACITIAVLVLCAIAASARQWQVGPAHTIKTIKAAIQKATAGDTVCVYPGLYKEGNIVIPQSIYLQGIDNPVLDGEKKYEILTLSGNFITVTGFVFKNSGYSAMNDFASIKMIDAGNITISHNKIYDAYFGIHCSNSHHIVINHNELAGLTKTEQTTGNGIHLWKCNNATITANKITHHRDGIYFEFVSFSKVVNNTSEQNIRYGLHFMFSNNDQYLGNTFRNNGAGVAVMYSKGVQMRQNSFQHNWGASAYGLLLKDITDSHIQLNVFYKNTVGVFMEGSSRIEIEKNTFNQNGWALKVQASCNDNTVTLNNFSGNSFDVGTNGSLVLNSFTKNYWDKYEGYDLRKDGTGDVPYRPVSLYSMLIEQNPGTVLLMRSFTISLLDKAEKVMPSLTPEQLADTEPSMKPIKL